MEGDHAGGARRLAYTLILSWLVVSLIAIATTALYFSRFAANGLSLNTADWAEFGEYIGGVLSPFLAWIGLAGVASAIWIQWRQLIESRQALADQLFDGRFFSMLSLYNESIKGVNTKDPEGAEVFGYAAIRVCLHDFFHSIAAAAGPFIARGQTGFIGEFYPILGGYAERYLGGSTVMMVLYRIRDVAVLIEEANVEHAKKVLYHQLFSSYISEETKVWFYIFFVFTKWEELLPPEYGCEGSFMEYMYKQCAARTGLDQGTCIYLTNQIREMVATEMSRARGGAA